MNETTTEQYPNRPRLRFTRANARGTGSSILFELHPAHDITSGSIFVTLAPQKTIGSREAGAVVFPTFDWENKVCVKLDFTELAEMLMVFHGLQEAVMDGKGFFHRSLNANTIVKFSHLLEPRPGYLLEVSRKAAQGDLQHISFLFSMPESYGLAHALENALAVVGFGIPRVIPRAARPVPEAQAPVAVGDPF